MRNYLIAAVFLIVAAVAIGASGYLYFEYYGKPRCEACGMVITAEMSENFHITDLATGQRVWSCCSGCALRLAAAHQDLHIEALDSWYGTVAPYIEIEIRGGNVSGVSPNSTLIVLGSKISGGCASNRIAINETSAQLLLQDGYNPANPLSVFKNPVPDGAPLMNVTAALVPLKQKGIQYVPPSAAFLVGIAIAGMAVLAVGILAWKKLLTKSKV